MNLVDNKPKVLYRTELQKALDYHLIKLNFPNIKIFTEEDFKKIIKQILQKYKLWNKYQDLIENYEYSLIFPIDLRFIDFQQIKYTIILKDNEEIEKYHPNLILDLRVNYKNSKNNC